MSKPRAVGLRAPYSAMPQAVRAWVEDSLGSPVVEAVDQVGGMSPGCATRVRCADGTRAFVKAVTSDLNPDTPTLFRREITALTLLGEHPLWVTLRGSYDDGDHVALLLDDVEGKHPDLTDDATMERLLAATDDLGAVLRARVDVADIGDLVGGVLRAAGLTDMKAVFHSWTSSFDELERLPEAPVPRWIRSDAAGWQARMSRLADGPSETLVHWDIRVDNLLQRPSGELVFLDWGAAGVGQPWLDPLLARLERVDRPWFDRSLATSPALAALGNDAVTTWLVGIGTALAVRAVTAVDVNLPTLPDFRRAESARFLGAAARRLAISS